MAFAIVTRKLTERQLSEIFNELRRYAREGVNEGGRERPKLYRVTTGRTSDFPPHRAPYNFGIDPEWWEEKRHSFLEDIKDWMAHEDPKGFGVNRRTASSKEYKDPEE